MKNNNKPKIKQVALNDFVIMMSFINSCTIVSVLNITVPGISLLCHKIRLSSSDYSELNRQVRIMPLHIFAY